MNPILPASPVHVTTTGKKLCAVPLHTVYAASGHLLSCHATFTAAYNTIRKTNHISTTGSVDYFGCVMV
jgi:hypothetical protein